MFRYFTIQSYDFFRLKKWDKIYLNCWFTFRNQTFKQPNINYENKSKLFRKKK